MMVHALMHGAAMCNNSKIKIQIKKILHVAPTCHTPSSLPMLLPVPCTDASRSSPASVRCRRGGSPRFPGELSHAPAIHDERAYWETL